MEKIGERYYHPVGRVLEVVSIYRDDLYCKVLFDEPKYYPIGEIDNGTN